MSQIDFREVSSYNLTDRKQILKDAYTMLGWSLIPTAMGAALGHMLLNQGIFSSGMRMLCFIATFAMIFMVQKNRNSIKGIYWLMAFTGLMGISLGAVLTTMLRLPRGMEIIMSAALSTAAIFFVMARIGEQKAQISQNFGRNLFWGMVVCIIASLINYFFLQMPIMYLAISAVIALLSSLWIMYDINQAVNGGETSYISLALSTYLNIYNLFMSLLNLFGLGFGRDE
jgi:modulator of FtsH protease